MKRTWIVYVSPGIGHEFCNQISETRFYGPFTKEAARKLEDKLNAILDDDEDSEHDIAAAMPLDCLTPAQVIELARKMLA